MTSDGQIPGSKNPAVRTPIAETKLGKPTRPAPIQPPANALDSGPRPVLSLTGDADPVAAQQASEAALGEVGARVSESDGEAAADHGENTVAQAAPAVRISPTPITVPPVTLTALAPSAVTSPQSPSMKQAESSLSGWLAGRSTDASATLRTQQDAGRERIDQSIGEGRKHVDEATADTTARQQSVASAARQDVAGERERWTSAIRSMHAQYAASTRSKLAALDGHVKGTVDEADRGAKQEYAHADQAAQAEQARTCPCWIGPQVSSRSSGRRSADSSIAPRRPSRACTTRPGRRFPA